MSMELSVGSLHVPEPGRGAEGIRGHRFQSTGKVLRHLPAAGRPGKGCHSVCCFHVVGWIWKMKRVREKCRQEAGGSEGARRKRARL